MNGTKNGMFLDYDEIVAAYTRAVGRLFLLGAVARAKRPGCKFDTALILEGGQGSGKSSALRILGGGGGLAMAS